MTGARIMVLSVGIGIAVHAGVSVRRGRVSARGVTFERDERPLGLWFLVALFGGWGLALVGVALFARDA